MAAELDRLAGIFRNNGYYYITRLDLKTVVDTVVSALIDPNLDPFQQAALLNRLKEKREHPTINVVVEQRAVKDSSHLVKYHIGHVTVYPDLPIVLEDTITESRIDTNTAKGFTIVSRPTNSNPPPSSGMCSSGPIICSDNRTISGPSTAFPRWGPGRRSR